MFEWIQRPRPADLQAFIKELDGPFGESLSLGDKRVKQVWAEEGKEGGTYSSTSSESVEVRPRWAPNAYQLCLREG